MMSSLSAKVILWGEKCLSTIRIRHCSGPSDCCCPAADGGMLIFIGTGSLT